MKSCIIILLLIIFCSISAFSQSSIWSWAKNVGGSLNNDVNSITTDIGGNIYITGSFIDTVTFGNDTLIINNPTNRNLFLAKYDSSGNILWVTGAINCFGSGVKTDLAGNVYVSGGSVLSAIIGNDTLTNGGIFLAKYDSSGNFIWVRTGNQIGSSLTPSSNVEITMGNEYISGFFSGAHIVFGNDTITSGGFLVKYDSSGNQKWVKNIGSFTITTDIFGNIYLTSGFTGPSIVLGNDTLFAVNGLDFVAKYDSSGSVLWARNFHAYECVSSTTDQSGNFYLTGNYHNYGTFGNITLNNPVFNPIFLVKYSPAGNVIWAKSSGGIPNLSGGTSTGLTNDLSNNLYITGYFYHRVIFDSDTLTVSGIGKNDFFITKYDSSGNVLWAKSAGGDSSDYSKCITIDLFDNLYIGGTFNSDSIIFGNSTIFNSRPGVTDGYPPRGLFNIFVAKSVSLLTGINNNIEKENTILIYPNPTSSNFTLKIPSETKYVQVSNFLGQVLEKRMVKKPTELNFSIKENGIYFVQVATDKELITKKVVVCK